MSKNTRSGSDNSFIFARCKGERAHAISQIKHLPNVESVTPVTGRLDLVIKLHTNEPAKAFSTLERVRTIKSITSTETAISFQKITSTSRGDFDSENPIAFTLMKVKGTFRSVLQRLRSFPNFAEAHIIPGRFDILATFKGYSPEDVVETSVEKLGNITGVTASETLIAYNPPTTN